MIADPSRGANLEFLLTLLRVRRERGSEPQTIALSAVIGDTNGLERWLDARLLRRERAARPARRGCAAAGRQLPLPRRRRRRENVEPFIQPRVGEGPARTGSSRWSEARRRRQAGHRLPRDQGRDQSAARPTSPAASACRPPRRPSTRCPPATRQSRPTDAAPRARRRRGLPHRRPRPRRARWPSRSTSATATTVRVIVATTTLAMGVNTPAETVVIAGLRHPGRPALHRRRVQEHRRPRRAAGLLRAGQLLHDRARLPPRSIATWNNYLTARPGGPRRRASWTPTRVPRKLILRKSSPPARGLADSLRWYERGRPGRRLPGGQLRRLPAAAPAAAPGAGAASRARPADHRARPPRADPLADADNRYLD